jgi:membrane protein DedA with SNARE-associated domain
VPEAAHDGPARIARLDELLGVVATSAAIVGELPDVATELRRLAESLGPWAYVLLAGLIALESAAVLGLISPGEAVLAVGGAAAAHGSVELPLVLATAWIAGVAGDATAYRLGRRHGRAMLLRAAPRVGLAAERVDRLEALVRRWGAAALLAGRYIGLVRSLAPFLAGASGLPCRRVVVWSIAGAGLWTATSVLAGYAFASSLDAIGNVLLAAAGGLVLAWLIRGRREPAGVKP